MRKFEWSHEKLNIVEIILHSDDGKVKTSEIVLLPCRIAETSNPSVFLSLIDRYIVNETRNHMGDKQNDEEDLSYIKKTV